MTRKPLEDILIVDFCWVGAGSYTTKLLADQGADVIKIESSTRVDGIRLSGPFAGGVPGVNRSGYFADRNTSKRSCTINMKTPEGQDIARRLVAKADVVTNSFTPGVMDRFGLGWEAVHELNPKAVYLAMSMSGSTGPERDHLGYGLTIGSVGGLHGLTSLPGESPVGTGTNYPDHIPNPTHGAFAVLAALRHARRTGVGQYIDMSQTESTVAVIGPAVLEASASGTNRQPIGNAHLRHAPHGVYSAAGDDRWIAIAVTSDREYAALGRVLDIELPDDRFGADAEAVLADAVVVHDARDLAVALQEAGVPAAPVHDAQGVVDHDAQLRHRGHWVRLEHAEMGESLYNALPFRLLGSPTELAMPAPLLGEHTLDVCVELLGMTETEVAALVDAGVLV